MFKARYIRIRDIEVEMHEKIVNWSSTFHHGPTLGIHVFNCNFQFCEKFTTSHTPSVIQPKGLKVLKGYIYMYHATTPCIDRMKVTQ